MAHAPPSARSIPSRKRSTFWRRRRALRAKGNPAFLTPLAATGNGKFLPHTGAVLIKAAQGQIVGAAGASGGTGDEDEAICIAGIQATGLQHA